MQKTFYTLAGICLIAVSLVSCRSGRQFTHHAVEQETIKTIAVLPATVHYTGIMPRDMTDDFLAKMLDQQSLAFQRTMHDNLLRYSGGKKKIQGVSFQSFEKTNGLLKASQMDWRDMANADPDELARLLGVDAVVNIQVTSNRLMSDMASMALGTMKNVLFFATKTNPGVTSAIPSSTGDVSASASLVRHGKTLWNAHYNQPTDWQRGSDDVVMNVTKKMGKGFPY